MLASVSSRHDPNELKSRGFAARLVKPARRRELLTCIERLLTQERPGGSSEQPARAPHLGDISAAEPTCLGKVLLVEDNAVNQKVAGRFLQRLGYEVIIAGDGAQAVKAYEEQRFDAILMDLQMPVMDGYAATQVIRSKERGARIPIIALTASAMTGQLERCLAAQMDGLLTKPLLIDSLREKLEEFGLGAQPAEPVSLSHARE
jgi:two-component system sensor histidine kinase/response regulator